MDNLERHMNTILAMSEQHGNNEIGKWCKTVHAEYMKLQKVVDRAKEVVNYAPMKGQTFGRLEIAIDELGNI